MAMHLEGAVKDTITDFTRTGQLRASVRVRVQGNTATIFAGTKLNYARYVDEGTRPHVIRTVKKKALRWPTTGGYAFAKYVNHPGFKGHHYMQGTWERERNRCIAIIQTEINNAI